MLFIKKNSVVSLLLLFIMQQSLTAFSQTDTEFWFVAPRSTSFHESPANDSIRFKISSFGQSSDVTLSIPQNEPAGWPKTVHVPADSMVIVDLISIRNYIENWPFDQVLNKGIHITSTYPVTIYYEIGKIVNGEIFSLKGRNALGYEFYVPTTVTYANAGGGAYTDDAWSGIDVVATEDNTEIDIFLTADADTTPGAPALYEYTKLRTTTADGTCAGVYEWTRVQQTRLLGGIFNDSGTQIEWSKDVWIFADTLRGYTNSTWPAPSIWDTIGTRSDTIWHSTIVNNPTYTYNGNISQENYAPYRIDSYVVISNPYNGRLWERSDTMHITSSNATEPNAGDPGWSVIGIGNKVWSIDSASCANYNQTQTNQSYAVASRVTLFAGIPAGPKYYAGETIHVTLNAGQSYNVRAYNKTAGQHLGGSKITATKPIAVTVNEDSQVIGICHDIIGDQLVPTNIAGEEYIVVIGETTDGEAIVLLGTEDNTKVRYYDVNGTLDSLMLDAGTQREIKVTGGGANIGKSMYFKADKAIYVYQITSISTCEAGSALLPPIVCTGSQEVAFSRTQEGGFAMVLLTRDMYKSHFTYTVQGNTPVSIPDSVFQPVPGTANKWVAARIGIPNRVLRTNTQCIVKNSIGIFHLGISNGYPVCNQQNGCPNTCTYYGPNQSLIDTCLSTQSYAGTGTYGYFSNFGAANFMSSEITRFNKCGITLTAQESLDGKYKWYKTIGGLDSLQVNDTLQTYFIPPDSSKVRDTLKVVLGQGTGDCTDEEIFYVNYTLPRAALDSNICDFQNVSYNASIGNFYDHLMWDDSSTNPVRVFDTTGKYHVTFWDEDNCWTTDTLNVELIFPPMVDIVTDGPACAGDVILIDIINTYDPEHGISYEWSNGETLADSIYVTSAVGGSIAYTVTVTNRCGGATAESALAVFSAPGSKQSTTHFSEGSCSFVLAGDSGMASYSWSSGATTETISLVDSSGAEKDSILYLTMFDGVCYIRDTFLIHFTLPSARLDTSLCISDSVKIDVTKNWLTGENNYYTQLRWDNGDTLPVRTIDSAGIYVVAYYDGPACVVRDTFRIVQVPLPKVDLLSQEVCAGDTIWFRAAYLNETAYDWNTGGAVQWGTGDSLNIIWMTDFRDIVFPVSLTTTNRCGAPSTEAVSSTFRNPGISDNTIHYNGCSFTLSATAGRDRYLWSNGSTETTLSVIDPGTAEKDSVIILTSFVQTVCIILDTFNVHFTLPEAGLDTNICSGNQVMIDVSENLVTGENNYYTHLLWEDSTSSPTRSFDTTANYYVTFFDGPQCAKTDTFRITIYPEPDVNLETQSLCSFRESTLDAGEQPYSTYLWSTGDDTRVINLKTNKPGDVVYTVTVSNPCQVQDIASVAINFKACEIEVPNVITPNGDGINDYLYINNVEHRQWEVVIYNRWGQKIWESSHYMNNTDEGWTGDNVSDGVYYYIVRTYETGQEAHGYIHVVRGGQ